MSSGVFAILISLTWMTKIQNSLPLHKFRQKLANCDVTKEALNCTASLPQLTALLMLLVSLCVLFCDPKKFHPNLDPAGFEFLNPARFETVKSGTSLQNIHIVHITSAELTGSSV